LELAIQAARAVGFEFEQDDAAVREYLCKYNYQVPLVHPTYGLLEIHYGLYRDLPENVAPAMLDRAYPSHVYGRKALRLVDADLFFVLAVHLARSQRAFVWSWLMDLALLGAIMSIGDWELLCERTIVWGGQLYVLACVRMLSDLWGRRPDGLSVRMETVLTDSLRWPERLALRHLKSRLPAAPLGGDKLRIARYLARRPENLQSPWRKLVPHPGVVCIDMGVRSDDPEFARHRLRHALVRARRFLASADS
jgi:hypothetical protein